MIETTEALAARYAETRRLTLELVQTLTAEDMQVQSMEDVSPTKWHLGHTTWFFETFILEDQPGYRRFDPRFREIFNSYYEQVGAKHPRPERGLLTRPPLDEVLAYRRHVDAAIELHFADDPADRDLQRLELGIHHEQQHQELLLMDIKHVLGCSPLDPAYRPGPPPARGIAPNQRWHDFQGGEVGVGHDGPGFAFDHECPRHRVLLDDFALAHRLVTNREWADFIADGGYGTPTLWLSDGWAWVQENAIEAPATWRRDDGAWTQFTLHGREQLRAEDPVTHLSYYEADAFARWSGARLPTEFEWEHAAATQPADGHFLDGDTSWHPRPPAADGEGCAQLYGDAWEWTASPYTGYPGFRPAAGAVGEYNGKFMANQFVLRGGCFATPRGHVRPTYRNFFHPHTRWHFSGVRLARDPG